MRWKDWWGLLVPATFVSIAVWWFLSHPGDKVGPPPHWDSPLLYPGAQQVQSFPGDPKNYINVHHRDTRPGAFDDAQVFVTIDRTTNYVAPGTRSAVDAWYLQHLRDDGWYSTADKSADARFWEYGWGWDGFYGDVPCYGIQLHIWATENNMSRVELVEGNSGCLVRAQFKP